MHKGLGEMQTLAAGVGDLKRVLSNVKTRGVFGETQLAALLEQVMAPEQYEKNVATRPGSNAPGGVRHQAARQGRRRPGAAADRREVSAGGLPAAAGRAGGGRPAGGGRWPGRRSRRGSSSKREASPRNTSSRRIRPISRCSTCRSRDCSPRCCAGPGLFDHIQRESRVTICGPDQPARLSQQPADGLPHARHPAALLARCGRCSAR